QPTYRLHYGIPGASHAFTIARRVGLPEKLLNAAEDYLGQGEREGVAIIERLQTLRASLDEELLTTQRLKSRAEEDARKARRELDEIESGRTLLLDEARQQGVRLLASAEERLQELFRQAPKGSTQPKQRAELTSAVRALHEALPQPLAEGPEQVPEDVVPGEKLYVPALGVEAEVVVVDGSRVELLAGGKKLRQPLSALRQFQPRRYVSQQKLAPKIRDRVERKAFLPRLVLVGKRVEDASLMLDRFLDDALLHGELHLEIVHGSGQGVLRRVVREFLAGRKEVAAFQAAAAEQGGDNVTIVELRH
ncbi:MAG: endonuclease MutS2, partial [Deltaproteobacteria bacterium]